MTVIAIGVSISTTVGGFDLRPSANYAAGECAAIRFFVWHGFGTTESIVITLAPARLVGLFNAFS